MGLVSSVARGNLHDDHLVARARTLLFFILRAWHGFVGQGSKRLRLTEEIGDLTVRLVPMIVRCVGL